MGIYGGLKPLRVQDIPEPFQLYGPDRGYVHCGYVLRLIIGAGCLVYSKVVLGEGHSVQASRHPMI